LYTAHEDYSPILNSYHFVPDYLDHMQFIAELLIGGYLLHYIPFHLIESTYFLYHYLPAVLFKLLFVAIMMEQAYLLIA
jgi:dolichyl-phosphate-mannose-protein mannosyltransferase